MWVRRTALVMAAAMGLVACGRANPSATLAKTRAHAVPIAAVHASPKNLTARLPERVFAFGDAFGAVDYQLSFTGSARDGEAVTNACAPLLGAYDELEVELKAVTGDAGDVAARLLGSAASAVRACKSSPSTIDDAASEAVHLDFGSFRELAFDFAQLVKPAA